MSTTDGLDHRLWYPGTCLLCRTQLHHAAATIQHRDVNAGSDAKETLADEA